MFVRQKGHLSSSLSLFLRILHNTSYPPLIKHKREDPGVKLLRENLLLASFVTFAVHRVAESLVISILLNRAAWYDNLRRSHAKLWTRNPRVSSHIEVRRAGRCYSRSYRKICTPRIQRILPRLSLCHHLQPEHPARCRARGFPVWRAYHPQVHERAPISERTYETHFRRYVRLLAVPISARAAVYYRQSA